MLLKSVLRSRSVFDRLRVFFRLQLDLHTLSGSDQNVPSPTGFATLLFAQDEIYNHAATYGIVTKEHTNFGSSCSCFYKII